MTYYLTAFASQPIGPGEVGPELIGMLAKAYESQAWALLAGLLLTLAVWVANTFVLAKVKPAHMRWVALGLSVVTSVGLGLQGGQDWMTILVTGLTVGLTSIGMWETAGKTARDTLKRASS